jgi:quinol-cytochrome oxidoreductase complex cytochrome b subunit
MKNGRVQSWLFERIPIPKTTWEKPLREDLPIHLKEWVWCLGGTPLLLFAILATTGILLTFYYVPYPEAAYQSVQQITERVRLGWFLRGMHKAAGHLMIIAVLLHMIRVFVTRAYRKPRELNWMVGVALFLTVLGFAFTGYALVYDQLSYWATTVGTNMIAELPLLGKPLLYFLRGGPDVNSNTLTRLYNFHIGVLPTIMVLLLGSHLLFLRLHGVAKLENDPRAETYPFFPNHVLTEIIIGLIILIGIVNYAVFFPPAMGPPANPDSTPSHIRPEWYFFPSYRWLKIVPLQVGLWGSLVFILGMLLWPFLDAFFDKRFPGKNVGRALGIAGWMVTITFLIWETLSS